MLGRPYSGLSSSFASLLHSDSTIYLNLAFTCFALVFTLYLLSAPIQVQDGSLVSWPSQLQHQYHHTMHHQLHSTRAPYMNTSLDSKISRHTGRLQNDTYPKVKVSIVAHDKQPPPPLEYTPPWDAHWSSHGKVWSIQGFPTEALIWSVPYAQNFYTFGFPQ